MATTPVLRGTATTGSAASGTTFTISKPTGVVQGDLVVAWVANGGSGGATAAASISGGSTWNVAGTGQGLTSYGYGTWFWSVAGASEPASYTVTFDGASAVGGLIAYQANTYELANPIDTSVGYAYNSTTTQTTAKTAPSVAGGLTSGILLSAFTDIGGTAATPTFTMGGTQTELLDANAGATGYVGIAVGTLTLAADGTTTAQTATSAPGRRAINGTVVIRPYSQVAYTQTKADTAAAVDSATAGLTLPRTAGPDTAAGTDAASAVLTKGAADVAAAVDAMTRVSTLARTPADTAAASDIVTAVFARSDIVDYQFVLGEGPSDTALPWIPFGLGQTVVVEAFDPGAAETRTQDTLSPVADVRRFGVDRRTPPVWSFDLYTDVLTTDDALAWTQIFETVWDQEDLRTTPDDVLPLRYSLVGRVRRVYGRPRNFAAIPTLMRTGRMGMVADFHLAENTYYDDTLNTVQARMFPAVVTGSRTGFTFPLTFPAASTPAATSRQEQLIVGGTRATWIDLEFHGPSRDPWVLIGGQRWGLTGSIAAGASVRLSGVPWQQGVLRSDGAWVPGMLDPRARLSALRLKPGTYTATYGGYTLTTDSRVDITWRNAWGSM